MNYYSIQGEYFSIDFEKYINSEKDQKDIEIKLDKNATIILNSDLETGFLMIKGFKLVMNIVDDGMYDKYTISHKLLPFDIIGTFDKSLKHNYDSLKSFNLNINWYL